MISVIRQPRWSRDRIVERIEAVGRAPCEDFRSLLTVAELDPARDLRFIDWSGADLSGCDLSGCDFTGANLRGCRFEGARIAAAQFDQAQVDRAQLWQAADWQEHTLGWKQAEKRGGDRHLPDLATFSDSPLAPELIALPPGKFLMGSPESDQKQLPHEGPQHMVTIGRGVAIGRYPVTFYEYDLFCDAEGQESVADKGWGRGRRPIINLRWDQVQSYIAWLSRQTGLAYRLPSEAEWEYACRAGTTTQYSFGDKITPADANYSDSAMGCTSEVECYPPNPWGFYGMHGNTWDWVRDDWHDSYCDAPTDGAAWRDQRAAPKSTRRVIRGGSWLNPSEFCRSAYRIWDASDGQNIYVGFRVARNLIY